MLYRQPRPTLGDAMDETILAAGGKPFIERARGRLTPPPVAPGTTGAAAAGCDSAPAHRSGSVRIAGS